MRGATTTLETGKQDKQDKQRLIATRLRGCHVPRFMPNPPSCISFAALHASTDFALYWRRTHEDDGNWRSLCWTWFARDALASYLIPPCPLVLLLAGHVVGYPPHPDICAPLPSPTAPRFVDGEARLPLLSAFFLFVSLNKGEGQHSSS